MVTALQRNTERTFSNNSNHKPLHEPVFTKFDVAIWHHLRFMRIPKYLEMIYILDNDLVLNMQQSYHLMAQITDIQVKIEKDGLF